MAGWQHWTTPPKIGERLRRMAARVSKLEWQIQKRLQLDPCSNAASTLNAKVELWGTEPTALVPYVQRAMSIIEKSHAESESMGDFKFSPAWARKVHPEEREAIAMDAARGGLAADMARCAADGRTVLLEDGLTTPWTNHALADEQLVYMNSPFASGLVDLWTAKAASEGEAGLDVVGMVANATASRWFHEQVFARCSAGLFLKGRLGFGNAPPDTKAEGASVQNVLVHWGPNVQAFMETFWDMGELFSMRASKQQMQWTCSSCDRVSDRVPDSPQYEQNQQEVADAS